MTDDSVIIILERRKERELKEENIAFEGGSLRPKRKTTLTLKSSVLRSWLALRR